MKTRLFVAVLALFGLVTKPSMAGETFTQQVRKFERARRIERANIQAMIDPAGSFSVTYWGKDTASQCPINPNWDVTITQREDLDGVYISSGCTHEGPIPCFCDIYVRTLDTKQAWEAALEPYRQEYRRELQVDPSPDAKVVTGSVTYTTQAWRGPVSTPSTVNLASPTPIAVARGEEFDFIVDASVPVGAQSPCAVPDGRACRLTTELWSVKPDGTREPLMFHFEIGEMGKVWLRPGQSAQVAMHTIFPHPKSVHGSLVPSGKAVLVGKWFLWKYYSSPVDYQVPVGQFEVALDIR